MKLTVRGGNSSAWRLTTAAFKLAAKQMASFMFFVFVCALQVSCALICVFLSLNTVSLCAIGLYSELVRRNEILKNGFVSVLEVNSLSLFLAWASAPTPTRSFIRSFDEYERKKWERGRIIHYSFSTTTLPPPPAQSIKNWQPRPRRNNLWLGPE